MKRYHGADSQDQQNFAQVKQLALDWTRSTTNSQSSFVSS